MKLRWPVLLALALLTIDVCAANPASADKPHLLVLTDFGGDPGDQQSMVRLLLYANEFELEGLIATASGTPGELKENVTKPQLIREIVDACRKVGPNLLRHAEGYPSAELLRARVKTGNPNRGREAVGAGRDTEGSCASHDNRPGNTQGHGASEFGSARSHGPSIHAGANR
jgi:hypothetical protein